MGKSSKKEKKVLPPVKPPKVAYFLFRDEIYEQTKTDNQDLNRGDLAQLISNKWDNLTKEKKQQYEERLNVMKQDYLQKAKQYEEKYGEIPETAQRPQSKPKKKASSSDKSKKEIKSSEEEGEKKSSKKKVIEKGQEPLKGKNSQKKKQSKNSKSKKGKGDKEDNTRLMWVVDKNAKYDDDDD